MGKLVSTSEGVGEDGKVATRKLPGAEPGGQAAPDNAGQGRAFGGEEPARTKPGSWQMQGTCLGNGVAGARLEGPPP